MGLVRLLYRAPLLVLSTALCFALWLVTRAFGLFSARAARRSHAWIVSTWARLLTRLLGVRIEVEGPLPRAPFFLVSNHLSYLDIPVLLTCLDANFLAKSEVAHWPLIGPLARATGTLFIDRSRPSDLRRVMPQVRRVLAGGRGVIIFPEGTSTSGAQVLPFRSALFEVPAQAGLAVHTLALHYRTPPGSPPASLAVCWWGEMTFGGHFLAMLRLPTIEARIRLAAKPLHATDRRRLALDARECVLSLFEPLAQPPLERASCPS